MSTRHTDPFEDELAELLHRSGGQAPVLDVATSAVLHEGSRVVRRRRTAGAGALAAAAVLALGGYAVLTGGVGLAGDLRPATSSESTELADVGVVTAELSLTSVVDPDVGPGDPGEQNPLLVSIELDTAAERDNLHYRVVEDRMSGTRELGGLATVGLDGRTTRITVPEVSLVLTVQPVSQWVSVVSGPDSVGGSTGAEAVLGDTGLDVRAVRFSDRSGPDTVTGMVRADSSGVVHDDAGNVVSSARASDGSVFYHSERLDVFGVRLPWGGGAIHPSDQAPGEPPLLSVSHGLPGEADTVLALLVEAGASDAAAEVVGGSGAGSPTTLPVEILPLGPSGSDLAVLYASYPAGAASGEEPVVVTWTAADGTQHRLRAPSIP